jgi:death on curing protein
VSWRFISKTEALALHRSSVAEHGGASELRDEGLLESALARPLNLAAYGQPSITELAASYAYGLARNHPFIDGNKRCAFLVSAVFLELNGWELAAAEADAAVVFLKLAGGELEEVELARWFEENAAKIP